MGNTEREEDQVLRSNDRKTRHSLGIWEGSPEVVTCELTSEEGQGYCYRPGTWGRGRETVPGVYE